MDFSWGKGGRCVWLTTYHACSAETSRKFWALIYPNPLGQLGLLLDTITLLISVRGGVNVWVFVCMGAFMSGFCHVWVF